MDEVTFHSEMQELIRRRMADPMSETGRILRQMQEQAEKRHHACFNGNGVTYFIGQHEPS